MEPFRRAIRRSFRRRHEPSASGPMLILPDQRSITRRLLDTQPFLVTWSWTERMKRRACLVI
jgi:hypothetical protein